MFRRRAADDAHEPAGGDQSLPFSAGGPEGVLIGIWLSPSNQRRDEIFIRPKTSLGGALCKVSLLLTAAHGGHGLLQRFKGYVVDGLDFTGPSRDRSDP